MHPLIEKAKREGRHLLEPEALSLLQGSGISVPRHVLVHTESEAREAARSLGWPVVMKIVSPEILHKTDVGGVVLNVQDEREAGEAFSGLSALETTQERMVGVLVYPFQPHDVEVSAGMVRDSQFGPVITFGLGGIWIEALRDIAYGIAPLSYQEAEDMLRSIQAHRFTSGTRRKLQRQNTHADQVAAVDSFEAFGNDRFDA